MKGAGMGASRMLERRLMASMRRTDRLTRQLEIDREMQYRQQRDMVKDAQWQQSRQDEQDRYKADMAMRLGESQLAQHRWQVGHDFAENKEMQRRLERGETMALTREAQEYQRGRDAKSDQRAQQLHGLAVQRFAESKRQFDLNRQDTQARHEDTMADREADRKETRHWRNEQTYLKRMEGIERRLNDEADNLINQGRLELQWAEHTAKLFGWGAYGKSGSSRPGSGGSRSGGTGGTRPGAMNKETTDFLDSFGTSVGQELDKNFTGGGAFSKRSWAAAGRRTAKGLLPWEHWKNIGDAFSGEWYKEGQWFGDVTLTKEDKKNGITREQKEINNIYNAINTLGLLSRQQIMSEVGDHGPTLDKASQRVFRNMLKGKRLEMLTGYVARGLPEKHSGLSTTNKFIQLFQQGVRGITVRNGTTVVKELTPEQQLERTKEDLKDSGQNRKSTTKEAGDDAWLKGGKKTGPRPQKKTSTTPKPDATPPTGYVPAIGSVIFGSAPPQKSRADIETIYDPKTDTWRAVRPEDKVTVRPEWATSSATMTLDPVVTTARRENRQHIPVFPKGGSETVEGWTAPKTRPGPTSDTTPAPTGSGVGPGGASMQGPVSKGGGRWPRTRAEKEQALAEQREVDRLRELRKEREGVDLMPTSDAVGPRKAGISAGRELMRTPDAQRVRDSGKRSPIALKPTADAQRVRDSPEP